MSFKQVTGLIDKDGAYIDNANPLPVSATISGNPDTNINSWLGSTSPTVGQKASAASIPVVMASDVAPPLPVGAATAALQTNGNTYLSSIDGKLSLDAFGRLQVSEPYTIFDSKQLFDKQPAVWDDAQVSGSGTTSTYNTNQASTTIAVSAATAGVRVRQTFRWFNYQPGKGQFVELTGVLGAPATGITRECGLFNDQNGVFFRSSGTTVSVVVRSFVTGSAVETVVPQASWNVNTMSTVDWSKAQIFAIDFEWLGVGIVRFFLNLAGVLILVHQINNANALTVVWMSTPNLPLRWRIANDGTGGAASSTHICSTIMSQGGVQDPGNSLALPRTTVFTTINNASIWPLQGLRLKSTHLGISVIPRNLSLVCASNALFAYFLILNPTIAGAAPAWAGLINSAVETATATTNVNTVTGGTILAAGVVQQTNEASVFVPSPTGFVLGSTIAGVPQEIWLCVQKLVGGSEDFYSSMSWGEL